MFRNFIRSSLPIMITLSLLLASCGGLSGQSSVEATDDALKATQTSMAIFATNAAVQATQTEMANLATQAAAPTATLPPSPTVPPTDTPVPSPTADEPTPTPEVTSTTASSSGATSAGSSNTSSGSGAATPVSGQERIRIENNSGQNFTISLRCIASVCVGKNPSSYKYTFPPGLHYIYVWPGRYSITWTTCGKTTTFQHQLNGSWYIKLKKCN